ncbi:hypothetical protein BaRGS_00021159 [Batillaria attramentaria]|uniref:Secreted protein n=1 Tax=Batillaria attramentaria TaxID=370345 RepID=A0ABD0KK98_9CAEN
MCVSLRGSLMILQVPCECRVCTRQPVSPVSRGNETSSYRHGAPSPGAGEEQTDERGDSFPAPWHASDKTPGKSKQHSLPQTPKSQRTTTSRF